MLKTLSIAAGIAGLSLTTAVQADDMDQRIAEHLDREDIEQLMVYYGRANDIIGRGHADRDAAREAAVAEYERAFTDDATITVFPLGSETPLQSTNNIPDWSAFVAGYFVNENYSSTLHLMSNFVIDFTDEDTAQASAFAINPHFILNREAGNPDAATRGMDLMNVRYEYEAERQEDGEWRIVDMTIHLDEIFNGIGFFGAGQSPS